METRYGFSKEIFYIIIDVFKKYSYAIEKVILFGSRARGDYKRTSDIDIAIKFKKNPEKISNIIEDMEASNIIYTMDIIEIALKKTTSKSNFNFDYLDKLISNWHEHNLLTTTDVNNYLAQMKIQNQNKKTLEKQTNYKSFEQRTYNDLDSLYANN